MLPQTLAVVIENCLRFCLRNHISGPAIYLIDLPSRCQVVARQTLSVKDLLPGSTSSRWRSLKKEPPPIPVLSPLTSHQHLPHPPWTQTWTPRDACKLIIKATTPIVASNPQMTASFPPRPLHSHNQSSEIQVILRPVSTPIPTTSHRARLVLTLEVTSHSTANLSSQCQHTRVRVKASTKANIKGTILQHHSRHISNVKVDIT